MTGEGEATKVGGQIQRQEAAPDSTVCGRRGGSGFGDDQHAGWRRGRRASQENEHV